MLLLATITLVVVRNNQHRGSYEYQVQKAEAYTAEKNYVKALSYYKKAVSSGCAASGDDNPGCGP